MVAALEAVPEQRGAREARKVSRRRMVAPPAFGAVAAIENFCRSRVTDTTGFTKPGSARWLFLTSFVFCLDTFWVWLKKTKPDNQ